MPSRGSPRPSPSSRSRPPTTPAPPWGPPRRSTTTSASSTPPSARSSAPTAASPSRPSPSSRWWTPCSRAPKGRPCRSWRRSWRGAKGSTTNCSSRPSATVFPRCASTARCTTSRTSPCSKRTRSTPSRCWWTAWSSRTTRRGGWPTPSRRPYARGRGGSSCWRAARRTSSPRNIRARSAASPSARSPRASSRSTPPTARASRAPGWGPSARSPSTASSPIRRCPCTRGASPCTAPSRRPGR